MKSMKTRLASLFAAMMVGTLFGPIASAGTLTCTPDMLAAVDGVRLASTAPAALKTM